MPAVNARLRAMSAREPDASSDGGAALVVGASCLGLLHALPLGRQFRRTTARTGVADASCGRYRRQPISQACHRDGRARACDLRLRTRNGATHCPSAEQDRRRPAASHRIDFAVASRVAVLDASYRCLRPAALAAVARQLYDRSDECGAGSPLPCTPDYHSDDKPSAARLTHSFCCNWKRAAGPAPRRRDDGPSRVDRRIAQTTPAGSIAVAPATAVPRHSHLLRFDATHDQHIRVACMRSGLAAGVSSRVASTGIGITPRALQPPRSLSAGCRCAESRR